MSITDQHIVGLDPDGYPLAFIAPECVARALATGARRIPGRRDAIALRSSAAKPLRELTPEEKRRLVLARERAKR